MNTGLTRINNNSQRNASIDLLKGICILFVVITHFSWLQETRLKFAFAFWIDMAVPIFMIISGYVNSSSYIRKEITGLKQAYSFRNWLKSFIRYTIPYLIIFAIETVIKIILYAIGVDNTPWHMYFYALITGGWGPGSYYYPILIQFLVIFPFIYLLIKKYALVGLIECFLINFFWEIIKLPLSVSESCYRLLIFRYIFLVAVGCYAAIYGFSAKKAVVPSLLFLSIGTIFLIYTQYLGYKPIIFKFWTTTSLPAVFIIIPLCIAFIQNINKVPKILSPIIFLGKASYNIFFMQMVFYAFAATKIEEAIGIRWLTLIIDLAICIALGTVFYYLETPLTKKITNAVYRHIK